MDHFAGLDVSVKETSGHALPIRLGRSWGHEPTYAPRQREHSPASNAASTFLAARITAIDARSRKYRAVIKRNYGRHSKPPAVATHVLLSGGHKHFPTR
jgi:hypothetical protein